MPVDLEPKKTSNFTTNSFSEIANRPATSSLSSPPLQIHLEPKTFTITSIPDIANILPIFTETPLSFQEDLAPINEPAVTSTETADDSPIPQPRKSSFFTKKDFAYEYFGLAAMAAKVASPYMEDVCHVSTGKELFNNVVTKKVPFHKW